MLGGGYLENDGSRNDGASTSKIKERGGLIPITAKILKDSTLNHEEAVEYQGILLSDVCIVGYLKKFNETDTKVLVNIWDQTGMVETVFYNKNENESHSGLANFNYAYNDRLVKIFGTVKTYRKEKNLQGAKIMYVDDNEFIYHQLEVVNDWLYLTGKNNESFNNESRNTGRSNNYNNNNNYNNYNNNNSSLGYSRNDFASNSGISQMDQLVFNTIKELTRNRNGKISKNELFVSLERKNLSHGQINSSIRNLNDNGYLFEEDDYYSLQY